jgi:hypothetical protein
MIATALWLLAQTETRATQPAYFVPVVLTLFVLGVLAWLVAAVLGFGRARSFGAPARWFALSAACLTLYHLHFLLIGIIGAIGISRRQTDYGTMLNVGAFYNLFVVLGAICAIIGFLKMRTEPETKVVTESETVSVTDSD